MFDYTRAAFRKIAKDFKTLGIIFHFAMQAVYIFYLAYALITQPDTRIVNIALMALALGYLAFHIVLTVKENSDPTKTKKEKKENAKKSKKAKKKAKKIFKWCKHILNLFPLILLIYTIWRTSTNVSPFAVILASLQLAGWVLSTLFKLIGILIENTVGLVIEGLKADVEPLTKPVSATTNFFKRITGQEVPEPQAPNHAREQLNGMVEQEREEKKEEQTQQKMRTKTFFKSLFHRNHAPDKALPEGENTTEDLPVEREAEPLPTNSELPASDNELAQLEPLEEIAMTTDQKKFWPWKK